MNLLARWAATAGLGLALFGVAGCAAEENEKVAEITSTPSKTPPPTYEDYSKNQKALQKQAYSKSSGYPGARGGSSGS